MSAPGVSRPCLRHFEQEPVPIHIVHAEGRSASGRLRAFVDFAAERLRADPALADPVTV